MNTQEQLVHNPDVGRLIRAVDDLSKQAKLDPYRDAFLILVLVSDRWTDLQWAQTAITHGMRPPDADTRKRVLAQLKRRTQLPSRFDRSQSDERVQLDELRQAWLEGSGRSVEEWKSANGTWHVVLTDTEATPGEYRADMFDRFKAWGHALLLAELAEASNGGSDGVH